MRGNAPALPRAGLVAGLAAALALATASAFAPALSNGFINYDDPKYVTENPHVRGGLDAGGFVWAWTTTHASNWHPLTWLSHMLDAEIFGDRAAGHHGTSLLIHIASVVLLFLTLNAATGSRGGAAAAALLFGVHPLRVESVAWVAERKDVLATFFWILAMYAHVARVRRPSAVRSFAVAATMAAGLLAKPMLVTLPLALLLLDLWPLGRWRERSSTAALLREKAPLFALAVVSSIVTLVVQSRVAMPSLVGHPIGARLANAVVAYSGYLGKTLVPTGLSPFYPHRGSAIPVPEVVVAAIVLAAVTGGALALRRRAPYVPIGWAWYLGTLVPVIGIVQVGGQAMADRYASIPSIGLATVAAFGARDLLRGRPRFAGAAALAVAVVLIPATRRQTERWRDSETLFRHALAVTENNDVAHNNLGVALDRSGRISEAVEHYRAALRARPGNRDAAGNLALALARTGAADEAIAIYEHLAASSPGDADIRNNLGFLLLSRGRPAAAIPHLEAATRIRRPFPIAWRNLATALIAEGEVDRARAAWSMARAQGAPADPPFEARLGGTAPAPPS